jgi:acetolactate synthase I/II/III large subunit
VTKPEKIVHVDIEERQIGRIFQPTLGIVADAKVFLSQLNEEVKASASRQPDYLNNPRVIEIGKTKEAHFQKLRADVGKDPIMPVAVGQVLSQEVPEQTLFVADEGFMVPGLVYGAAKYPSGFAPPLGFHYASLGSTLPVAIGAKLADPERLVISWGGDGGFFYDCSDLSFLAEHNLKVVVVINNNGDSTAADTAGRPCRWAWKRRGSISRIRISRLWPEGLASREKGC